SAASPGLALSLSPLSIRSPPRLGRRRTKDNVPPCAAMASVALLSAQQGLPGLRTDHAVNGQSTALLVLPHRGVCHRTKRAVALRRAAPAVELALECWHGRPTAALLHRHQQRPPGDGANNAISANPMSLLEGEYRLQRAGSEETVGLQRGALGLQQ